MTHDENEFADRLIAAQSENKRWVGGDAHLAFVGRNTEATLLLAESQLLTAKAITRGLSEIAKKIEANESWLESLAMVLGGDAKDNKFLDRLERILYEAADNLVATMKRAL